MKYDFDTIVDRKGTNCLKYDFAQERGKEADVLPLWVADMDFRTAPEILNQMQKVLNHGIFGYSEVKEDYFKVLSDWYLKHFNWKTENEWLVKTPGVVFAIAAAIRAFTNEGDSVLIQQPVYYPFAQTIIDNSRKLVNNPLKLINGHYEIDFEDFEEKIIKNNVKLFVLCSPHNPVGRVWKKDELKRLGDICILHNVIVVSDEIHNDFVYKGNKHFVFSSLDEKYAQNSVICTAPSKTFNLAGLQVSNIFIVNKELREKFIKAVDATGYSQLNVFGLAAAKAAYEYGEEWLIELKDYIYQNLCFVRKFLKERLPEIKLIEPEGTYLIWLDFRDLKLTEKEREKLLKEAKLWLDSGIMFGANGEGFERINIACPRKIIKQALEQLEKVINTR